MVKPYVLMLAVHTLLKAVQRSGMDCSAYFNANYKGQIRDYFGPTSSMMLADIRTSRLLGDHNESSRRILITLLDYFTRFTSVSRTVTLTENRFIFLFVILYCFFSHLRPDVGSEHVLCDAVLGQCLRYWPNVKPTLSQLAGLFLEST